MLPNFRISACTAGTPPWPRSCMSSSFLREGVIQCFARAFHILLILLCSGNFSAEATAPCPHAMSQLPPNWKEMRADAWHQPPPKDLPIGEDRMVYLHAASGCLHCERNHRHNRCAQLNFTNRRLVTNVRWSSCSCTPSRPVLPHAGQRLVLGILAWLVRCQS